MRYKQDDIRIKVAIWIIGIGLLIDVIGFIINKFF